MFASISSGQLLVNSFKLFGCKLNETSTLLKMVTTFLYWMLSELLIHSWKNRLFNNQK